MDITLLVQGSAAVMYAVHIFVRVMRNPQSVGAWLPRLVAGWHTGQREAEEAKQARKRFEVNQKAAVIRLTNTAVQVSTILTPRQVEAIGAGDPPAEIIEAAGK
jgi:hypothetical protein